MSEKSTAPALERGIRVLKYLENREQESLDAIACGLGYPKSSLLRVLDTLINERLVDKYTGTGTYFAKAVLVPRGKQGYMVRQEDLERVLKELAKITGCTTEWYVPHDDCMVLVRQAEPDQMEARIWAREGYRRSYSDELEAVAALGIAWVKGAPDPDATYRTYDTDGNTVIMTKSDVASKVKDAKEHGVVADTVYNSNGIRRLACVVRVRGVVSGILAIAEHFRPQNGKERDTRLTQLLAAGRQLSSDGKDIY